MSPTGLETNNGHTTTAPPSLGCPITGEIITPLHRPADCSHRGGRTLMVGDCGLCPSNYFPLNRDEQQDTAARRPSPVVEAAIESIPRAITVKHPQCFRKMANRSVTVSASLGPVERISIWRCYSWCGDTITKVLLLDKAFKFNTSSTKRNFLLVCLVLKCVLDKV